MWMNRLALICLLVLITRPGAVAQVVHLGYRAPEPPAVAPGQLVTFYAGGIDLTAAEATQLPLPPQLAGVEIGARRLGTNETRLLPILRVAPLRCDSLQALCPGAALTVQIPTDIDLCPGDWPNPCLAPAPRLLLSAVVGGKELLPEFEVVLREDAVHIVNSCDSVAGQPLCVPLVTHADGRFVSGRDPAQPGETLVVFALGLGPTNPSAETGRAVPAATPVFPRARIRAIFTLSAAAAGGASLRVSLPPKEPDFAGLIPGFVGLYQVNVTVPASFPTGIDYERCRGDHGTNAFLKIEGLRSHSEVPLCIAQ